MIGLACLPQYYVGAIWSTRNLASRYLALTITESCKHCKEKVLLIYEYQNGEREALLYDPDEQSLYVWNFTTEQSKYLQGLAEPDPEEPGRVRQYFSRRISSKQVVEEEAKTFTDAERE
jgi:hypothetical protein